MATKLGGKSKLRDLSRAAGESAVSLSYKCSGVVSDIEAGKEPAPDLSISRQLFAALHRRKYPAILRDVPFQYVD